MNVRTQLDKKIQAKNQEIAELETKIREARAYVQGLQEAIRMLPKDGADETQSEQLLRKGSDMDRTRDCLRKAGKPLYIDDILSCIGKENTLSLRRSLSSSLNVYARKGEIFIRTKPNTFGLVGMESSNDGKSSSDDEPPDDFGVMDKDDEIQDEDIEMEADF